MSDGAKPLGDKVVGYRKLTDEQIDQINAIKNMATAVGNLVNECSSNPDFDQRWVRLGKDDLQKGFMALVRSIARPESF